MKPLKVIIPIPNRDFDPTEVSVTWKVLSEAGHQVEFATPDGKRGFSDPLMLSGEGLDPWAWIPGLRKLRFIGLFLRANRRGRRAYELLQRDTRFLHPKPYTDLLVCDYDALVLPGGHAQGMKPYLESDMLQAFVAAFFETIGDTTRHKPVAAICHGVLLVARSISPLTHRSVLYGRKTTALTWTLESSAWRLSKYLGRFWDPGYYRTYTESRGESLGYWSVEQEVKRALSSDADFLDVPQDAENHFSKASGLLRDHPGDARPAWVVRDGNYVSARWPGDVHTFASTFVSLLAEVHVDN